MKKWIIFIGLKISEMLIFAIMCFGLTQLGKWWLITFRNYHYIFWWRNCLMGIGLVALTIGAIGVTFLLITAVVTFIRKNIEWSEKLSNKLKEKTK